MACRLFGAKPLSKSMITSCQLDQEEHKSTEYYMKFKCLHSINLFENIAWVMAAICVGLDFITKESYDVSFRYQ